MKKMVLGVALAPTTSFAKQNKEEEKTIANVSDANISEAVLASIEIEKVEDGRILFKADKLFLSGSPHKCLLESVWMTKRQANTAIWQKPLRYSSCRVFWIQAQLRVPFRPLSHIKRISIVCSQKR
ncbi:hypothetical protein [Pseudoalteromonas sp. A757]|uniref:hypothetical protein n=1 Tax=Pseudoalteromonas sp. A757 TaxID=2250709 RepID=UPI001396C8C0|nr:hypothetical protein [Pseudoalteromonas sp. A757]